MKKYIVTYGLGDQVQVQGVKYTVDSTRVLHVFAGGGDATATFNDWTAIVEVVEG